MADFDESDIPKEVPASEDFDPEPENVVRGHKANLSNPRRSLTPSLNNHHYDDDVLTSSFEETSEESKANSRKVLKQYDEPYDEAFKSSSNKNDGEKDPANVARGLKASISNPGVSEEAKKRAQEKLNAM